MSAVGVRDEESERGRATTKTDRGRAFDSFLA
jgi:hypothetical protein